ncbi:hypothetical protein PIIN_09668 [Serendipita indica DSM 11827]|uniref:RNase H type-1 domain-containing protein n=1 Tax=Serendipita indica (strain DSM 11827) TaxID=1109443 RepID=G4TWI5_SERID|nr:hypothetical protein PIIN_09668 [Serendipita indica DSM 11827]
MAEDLTYMSKHYALLPHSQFGGRPGRTTTDALHLLTSTIKKAWRESKVASALFLDIQAAFPNVVKPVLMQNMRAKGIPEEYVQTLENMLTGRSTHLKFDKVHSAPRAITNGNSQGCPLSMILYLFYIAPLLEIANSKDQLTLGFVDDSTLIAIGQNFHDMHLGLKDMMEREGGVLDWSRSHHSPLENNKLGLVDFTMSSEKCKGSHPLVLEAKDSNGRMSTVTIQPTDSCKLLGVVIDQSLRWNKHQELVHTRAVKWTSLFSHIHRAFHGLPIRSGRQLFNSVAIPCITYATDIWYTPLYTKPDSARQMGSIAITKKLQAVQRRAAISITGAIRTTAGDTLDAHLNMLPIKETLRLTCQKAAAQQASLPATHPLSKFVKRASRGLLQRHNAPLHRIFHSIDSKVDDLKTITPASCNPNATNPFTISIEESRMLAKEVDNNSNGNNERVVVYTDGSGMEGIIGAGAVLYRDRVRIRSARFLLGEDTEHTVHEGELVGIALGVQLAKMERIIIPRIKISLDNQAAIQGMENVSAKAGQHIIHKIHRAIDKLRNNQKRRQELVEASDDETRINRSTQITLTWVPGHEGIEGNKAADEEAKKAITDGSSTAATLPPWTKDTLPQNISALR